ncbi:hypothetical protein JB92DRAFT_2999308 [Gautieria morchelliformis]|nr:hypothetical protein JB92DRAFT_2999308 [Gautieria morchelliformis]
MALSDESVQQLAINLASNIELAYSLLSSLAVLAYDHMLTLDMEIQSVWFSRWSLGKVIYLGTSYSAWLDCILVTFVSTAPLSPGNCRRLYKAFAWLLAGGTIVAESALCFRTWALLGRTRAAAIGFLLAILALTISGCTFIALGVRQIQFAPNPIPGSRGCWLTEDIGQIIFVDFILVFIFELTMLAFVVYKGRQHLRQSHSNLVSTLYRDGILFYVYLIVFSLLNMVNLLTGPTPGPSFILMQRVLHSVLTKRMLLNLRSLVSPGSASRTQSSNQTSTRSDNVWIQHCNDTALSSVVIGVDTWFMDAHSETNSGTSMMEMT